MRLRNEALLGAILLVFGFCGLPVAVYFVGVQIVGPYEGEKGIEGLIAEIWAALGHGQIAAWVLVLSPYLVVQLVRLGISLHRALGPVKGVTE
jgi:hypothetical protein